jgi:hypothetical protein
MAPEIVQCSSYGVVMIEEEATHGYYLVKWASEPYMLQEEMEELLEGVLVCDAMYLSAVG